MSPAQILRAAREDSAARIRWGLGGLGGWSNGRVSVFADMYEGFWQYEVGTSAKRHAYGKPAQVLETLATLLQEYPA